MVKILGFSVKVQWSLRLKSRVKESGKHDHRTRSHELCCPTIDEVGLERYNAPLHLSKLCVCIVDRDADQPSPSHDSMLLVEADFLKGMMADAPTRNSNTRHTRLFQRVVEQPSLTAVPVVGRAARTVLASE